MNDKKGSHPIPNRNGPADPVDPTQASRGGKQPHAPSGKASQPLSELPKVGPSVDLGPVTVCEPSVEDFPGARIDIRSASHGIDALGNANRTASAATQNPDQLPPLPADHESHGGLAHSPPSAATEETPNTSTAERHDYEPQPAAPASSSSSSSSSSPEARAISPAATVADPEKPPESAAERSRTAMWIHSASSATLVIFISALIGLGGGILAGILILSGAIDLDAPWVRAVIDVVRGR